MFAVGELIGVEYLYRQTRKVLRMELPGPDEVVEESLTEDVPLDEGFIDEPVEVDDLTASSIDNVTATVNIISATIASTSVTELPETSHSAAKSVTSLVSISCVSFPAHHINSYANSC